MVTLDEIPRPVDTISGPDARYVQVAYKNG